jgi:hypothetical protein
MQRRTVFCTLVLVLIAAAALAQEAAPTPAPAEPAPQATPAPPPAEPAAQATPAAPPPVAPAPAAAAPAAAAAAPAAAAAAAPAAAAAAPAAQAAPAAAAPAAAAPPQAPAPVPTAAEVTVPRVYYEKAKVVIDGKAEYNGALELEWKPLNGQAKLVQVNVLAKSKSKDIARDIHKELVLAAGNSYKVKLNGERIELAKTNKKLPNFAITITKLQVSGVSVRVEK